MSARTGTRGIGQKSPRSEAIHLHRELRWTPERIAEALGEHVDVVREWIFGKRPAKGARGRPISEATPEQRAKVKGKACVACRQGGPVDPVHLIDRSLCTAGQDDPRAVVPMCRADHRRYDEEDLDALPFLEPHYREELAYAVERVGLLTTLFRVSGDRWVPA